MRTGISRKNVFVTVIAIGLATGYQPRAHALLPVTDAAHIFVNVKTQFDALAQYIKQLQSMATDAAHYRQVYQHYQQQLIKVRRMVSSLQFSGTPALSTVDVQDGVEQRCHKKPSGLSLRGLLNGLASNANGDILEEQQQICEAIQISENMKFNETVDFLARVRKETEQEMNGLAGRRDSGSTQGGVEANTNDAVTSGLRLDSIYRDYTAKIQMFDTQISALESRQRVLAQRAMKGETNPIGTLVKTGTLKAALSVGN